MLTYQVPYICQGKKGKKGGRKDEREGGMKDGRMETRKEGREGERKRVYFFEASNKPGKQVKN